ncbi:MAG: valine--tRNA ligase [Candidatus Korarchaeum sp.]|nr:valine--tRNA ligase [Candidatus Korarchaeum sp.]
MIEPKLKEKHWSPEMELEIQRIWNEERIYKFDPNSEKPIFSIDTPPPYASGKWHIAAAIHYSQIDMIARTMRMMGYEVYFPLGIDRNGLPVEVETEKRYKIRMFEYPREEFIKLCREFLDEAEQDIVSITKRLGISFTTEQYFQTDSELWRMVTQATFIDAWNKGIVYEDYRPNIYCPRCRTTLADAEVEYSEIPTKLVYLRFGVEGSDEKVTVATTRPELLPACRAVIYNPGDSRYHWLRGKRVVTPLGDTVPVLEHPYADPEFGTGLVMVCSYGDKMDVQLFRELGLDPKIVVDEDGSMNEAAGRYKGLAISEARQRILEDLEREGLLERVEDIIHRTPVCWRCKTPLEIIPMREYYLKQVDFIRELENYLNTVRFYPEWSANYWRDWLRSINSDWPISRRRYYATEIPVWYCKHCGKPVLPKPGKYYRPWKEDPPFDKCPHCGSSEGFEGETRVFDTWFDSSISPLVYNGYLWNDEMFKKLGPSDLRPQGKDIVRTWLHYTFLRVHQILGRQAFKHVWLSGMGLDAQGRAMHKSLGNVIYPWPLFERYGADAIRFFGAAEAHHGSDLRISERKIEGAYKFLQKLWNVARFISQFEEPEDRVYLQPTDLWILGRLNRAIERSLNGYKNFDFFDPANEVRSFVWDVFAPHYIELVKERAYGIGNEEEVRSARWTLHQVLRTILKLSAPIIPHITDYIWRQIYGGSVHLERLPEPRDEYYTDYLKLGEALMEFNSSIWRMRKEKNLSMREPIKAEIPEELSPFKSDLVRLHKISE